MAISQRTPTSGTAAASASFSITLPTGFAVGDFLVVAITNAGTAGPAAPTGWTLQYGASAGSGQFHSVYTAPYSAGLTLSFTNAASVAAWACGAYFESGRTVQLDVAVVAATSTSNNATMATGAPTSGPLAGSYEVLSYGWTSAATLTAASGMTVDKTQANGTTASVAIGHNNTASLGANTVCTAFAPTLSASNTRKTGVGIVLESVILKALTGSASGGSSGNGIIDKTFSLYKDITGSAQGRAQVGTAFLWGGGLKYGEPAAIWGATGVTVITGGPAPPGTKNLTGSAAGASVTTAALARRRALVAVAAGVATVTAALSRRRVLIASAVGSSIAAAMTTARRSLTGSSLGRATTNGFVDKAGSVFRPLLGSSAGKTTTTGATTRRRALTALSGGISTVSALLGRRRALLAAAVGRATTSGVPTRRRALVGAAAGRSTTSGTISSTPSVPTTSVIWVGNHFEMGQVGTMVKWLDPSFRTATGTQVIWENDQFKELVGT